MKRVLQHKLMYVKILLAFQYVTYIGKKVRIDLFNVYSSNVITFVISAILVQI